MVSYEEFDQMLDEIVDTLPEDFFRELSGGVILEENAKTHPASVGDNLTIMGEYCRNRFLGRYVVIYYGSFMRNYGWAETEFLKERLRKTVLHEFRHHLESLAGERDLEIEDQVQISHYTQKMNKTENNT